MRNILLKIISFFFCRFEKQSVSSLPRDAARWRPLDINARVTAGLAALASGKQIFFFNE